MVTTLVIVLTPVQEAINSTYTHPEIIVYEKSLIVSSTSQATKPTPIKEKLVSFSEPCDQKSVKCDVKQGLQCIDSICSCSDPK
jgi:hypothetical protein